MCVGLTVMCACRKVRAYPATCNGHLIFTGDENNY